MEHFATMSLWLDGEVSPHYPPLAGDVTADVAVVGAGVAGIATAYFLASAGAKVVVLEARGVAEAASGGQGRGGGTQNVARTSFYVPPRTLRQPHDVRAGAAVRRRRPRCGGYRVAPLTMPQDGNRRAQPFRRRFTGG